MKLAKIMIIGGVLVALTSAVLYYFEKIAPRK